MTGKGYHLETVKRSCGHVERVRVERTFSVPDEIEQIKHAYESLCNACEYRQKMHKQELKKA